MGKIIAIGGGEIGRPGFPVETTAIDEEIVRLSQKKKPLLLFLPTASNDSVSYFDVVQKHFGKKLGCQTHVLYLTKEKISVKEIEKKILSADIVYVGGGNTFKMMRIWDRYNMGSILKKAYKKGVILSGVSAGAVCWFRYGNSDSRKMNNPAADWIRVSGLGLIPAIACPHYDVEKGRRASLKKMMQRTPGVAIALDNCCAIECIDNTYRILSSKKTAHAYKVFWKDGKYHHLQIDEREDFMALPELLKK